MTDPTSRQTDTDTETRQNFQTTAIGQKATSGDKSQNGLDTPTY
jgi:hypothetical protein